MNTKGRFKIVFLLLLSSSKILVQAQVPGCTDPLASNFNPAATKNNGSCIYASSSTEPVSSYPLPDSLAESSGLLMHEGFLWSHNDDTDPGLYFWKPDATPMLGRKTINGVKNNDWEDLTRDAQYFYIGDFGNNGSGNRRNLNILRIADPSAAGTELKADTIRFTYEDQSDFTAQAGNSTDFDCEAFIAAGDSLYLFTKQWLSQKTVCYVLPKTPGNHVARKRAEWDVQGLITGASYLPGQHLVLLCGYNKTLQPFLYLLYDFDSLNFFSGNKRKISIDLGFHQIEGIATENGLDVYLSNEQLKQIITIAPKVHRIDLRAYLSGYLGKTQTLIFDDPYRAIRIYRNASVLNIHKPLEMQEALWQIMDNSGRVLDSGMTGGWKTEIKIDALPAGLYYLRLGQGSKDLTCKWWKE